MEASLVPECLKRFRELAQAFRSAVENGDTTAQERILTERRRLVSEMERQGPPRREGDREARAKILSEILEIDRDAGALLERQRREIGAQLVALEAGKRGLSGYGLGAGRVGKWIDERR